MYKKILFWKHEYLWSSLSWLKTYLRTKYEGKYELQCTSFRIINLFSVNARHEPLCSCSKLHDYIYIFVVCSWLVNAYNIRERPIKTRKEEVRTIDSSRVWECRLLCTERADNAIKMHFYFFDQSVWRLFNVTTFICVGVASEVPTVSFIQQKKRKILSLQKKKSCACSYGIFRRKRVDANVLLFRRYKRLAKCNAFCIRGTP